MKPFVINRSSWHFKLANWVQDDDYDRWPPTNFCVYSRSVLLGMVVAAMLFLVVCLIASMPVDFVIWLGQVVVGWHWVPMRGPGMIFTILSCICAISGSVMFCGYKLRDWYYGYKRRKAGEAHVEMDPGFMSTLYATTLGRFCIPVEVKD